MKQAAVSMDVLSSPDNLKILSNVLKTNVSAATSIGPFFTPQLGRIYMDMLGLYRAASGVISETVARDGAADLIQYWSSHDTHAFNRNNRNEDAKNSTAPNHQERNPQIGRNLHWEGGGFRKRE